MIHIPSPRAIPPPNEAPSKPLLGAGVGCTAGLVLGPVVPVFVVGLLELPVTPELGISLVFGIVVPGLLLVDTDSILAVCAVGASDVGVSEVVVVVTVNIDIYEW